jgi:hypothetical protein
MSMAYLAQPEQQPTVEWLAGGTFAVLLDAAATNGQLGVGGIVFLPRNVPHSYRITSAETDLLMMCGRR